MGVRLFAPRRRLVRQAMSCGGDHLHTRDAGRFVGEEALPDLVGPQERGPVLTYLQVVTTGVEVLPAAAFAAGPGRFDSHPSPLAEGEGELVTSQAREGSRGRPRAFIFSVRIGIHSKRPNAHPS